MNLGGRLLLGLGVLLILFFLWAIYWGLSVKSLKLVFNPRQVTPVSPLYYIKLPREAVQSLFIFGDQDQTLWNFTLAKKRLEEVQILENYNLKEAAQKQIMIAKGEQQKGEQYLNKLIDRIDTNFLVQFRNDNQKQIDLLTMTNK